MRVLYSFPTRLGTSGIGTTAWHQVAGLAEQGVELTVACGSLERPLPPSVTVVETLRPAGARVPYRLLGLTRTVRLHDRRAAALLASDGRFDVVHAWPLGAERTLAAARRLGVPGLLERPNAHTRFAYATVEQVCSELGLAVDPRSPHRPDPERLAREEREYALATGLLCPSDFVAKTFLDEGVPGARLLRHRYGYDPARFGPGRGAEAGRPFTVGFVGRGEPRKGLHLGLTAWLDSGAAAHGRFVVAGSIEPAYRELLEPLLAHPSVEERGQVDDPAEVLRSCDVLALPSLEEGSALVTYEGRACGCVLAVSDRAGAPGRDGREILVHGAGDVTVLSRQLGSLADDRALMRRMRDASLAGLRELTWSHAGRVLAGVYADVVSGETPRLDVLAGSGARP